jgi:hypothetical protein
LTPPHDAFRAGDPELLADVTAEIGRKHERGAFQLSLSAPVALQLAGALQLALRHPNFPAVTRRVIDTLLEALREYFRDCPLTLELLRQGDDPAYDVHSNGRPSPRAPRAPRSRPQ